MAQKAEEYSSHDKTFQMTASGVVRVDTKGTLLWNKLLMLRHFLECVEAKGTYSRLG
jgi:isocitrate dehydrogenase